MRSPRSKPAFFSCVDRAKKTGYQVAAIAGMVEGCKQFFLFLDVINYTYLKIRKKMTVDAFNRSIFQHHPFHLVSPSP